MSKVREQTLRDGPFLGALALAAPVVPTIATVGTVLMYTVPAWGRMRPFAFLAGTVVALSGWLLFALFAGYRRSFTTASFNMSSYSKLCDGLSSLHEQLKIHCPEDLSKLQKTYKGDPNQDVRCGACLRARRHEQNIDKDLQISGLPWVSATGYISVWNQLHRAQEQLVIVRPREEVINNAVYDELRLSNSPVPNGKELLARLRLAVSKFGPTAEQYLTALPMTDMNTVRNKGCPGGRTGTSGGSAGQTPTGLTGPPDDGSSQSSGAGQADHDSPVAANQAQTQVAEQSRNPAAWETEEQLQARLVLQQVRQALHYYRDSRLEGLVRVRNHLLVAMGLTGLVTHVLLGVAVTRGVPDKTIVAVTTYYLVGALVGLFSRLYAQTKTNMAVEDYGLYNVRLVLTPLLSGLAAISGVLLVAIISTAMQQPQPAAPPVPDLTTIFDLASYRTTLLTAAIFGLTPGLLIERLKQQTEQYKNDLQRTEGARAAPRDPEGQG